MIKLLNFSFLLCLFFGFGCTKKLELDIVESKCKDFRISDASYEFKNPNCPKNIKSNTLTIKFKYNGDAECLNSIHLKLVKFYNENNTVINPATLSSDSLSKTAVGVSVSNGVAQFDLDFAMNSIADYDNISYITVNFNTKNANGNESNRLAVVANLPCKSIPVPSITDGKIDVKSTQISVSLWDNAAEDGDIITIIVNGKIVSNNVEIFTAPKTFTFTIDPSQKNYISFYAVNEGTSSPNTASGTVNDGVSNQSFNLGMSQGESYSLDLVYKP